MKTSSIPFPVSRFSLTAFRMVLGLLLLTVLAGCVPSVKETETPMADIVSEHDDINTARLSLFLNLKEPNGPGIRLELTDVEVLADGVWLPVASGPVQLDSQKIGAGQQFLGGRPVPPGRYEKLRFTVSKSSVRQSNGAYEPASIDPYPVTLTLSAPLPIDKDNSQCLFITWDVLESVNRAEIMRPVMTITSPLRQLFLDLVYVACPEIDTIFVIRSDKNWVTDSFGVTGYPTYIVMDPDPSSRLLYVLASRESSIKIIELNSQRVVDSFSIPMVKQPAFMTVSPDGKSAYVLDKNESYLSRLDLESGNLLVRVRLGYEPQYAAYLVDRNIIAVSSVISQKVSFHDPLTLNEVGSVPTGNSPDGLLVSNNQLYIAENGSNTVSIFDFASNLIQKRLGVGFGPRRLLDNGDQIYVSNYYSGSLSVINPAQQEVGREILGLGRPQEMVYDQKYRWIYVGDEQEAGLGIVDSTINLLRGYIKLGARPLGLAIIQ